MRRVQPSRALTSLGRDIKHWLWQERKVWLTATLVAGSVIGLRFLGLLQPLELAALDQLLRVRPVEPVDGRIVIVGVDDADINTLQTWPIPDAIMAELLEKIRSYHPRAIGLDIYRDVPVGSDHEQLQHIFQTTPNLIGIEKIGDSSTVGVKAPDALKELGQIGFNNVIVDADGKVRRSILFWNADGKAATSFALRLSLLYLDQEGITPRSADTNPGYLQLGEAVFHRLKFNDGAYVGADMGGYQILANLRSPASKFQMIPLSTLLSGQVSPELMRDRIVLIGSTAPSLKDFFYTSYSGSTNGATHLISGVELHAQFISQIISAAQDGRSLPRPMAKSLDLLWILVWSLVGASLSWRFRVLGRSSISILLAASGLTGVCYLALIYGVWMPLVPPLITLAGSAFAITTYIAYLQEELKKSKEFLNSIINTIPDPVFVKDQNHKWIVLNHAYCRFIGHSLDALLEKSDRDFFPSYQATHFWQQDDITFRTGVERETEEEFTNTNGVTYAIATKRSLHKDAAGNLFLVGVIRDITQRKRVEEELRQAAADLVRSNTELKEAEDRLRRMAYHDTLTGLPNRELFHERLHQALDWAQAHDQLVALLFLDLDGFKQINDTYGHDMGNHLLKAVAQRLLGCLRSSDTVARLGGDEFVVLLPSIPSVQDVTRVAEKILTTLSQNFILDDTTIPVTTSIGISIYPHDTNERDTLLKKADLAMYDAKGMGKNCYQFSNTANNANL
jgi:diguanylate cyclase (GGDEF)-like protein/PAS domain S-box-containing protein